MAAYHGYGYDKIARELRSRKILTPSAYLAEQEGKPFQKDPYDWNLTLVYNMLNNRTYLGHCVNSKRTVLSFKNKRIVRKAEDEWMRYLYTITFQCVANSSTIAAEFFG